MVTQVIQAGSSLRVVIEARGIESTSIVNGRLMVSYSDGSVEDAGAVGGGTPTPTPGPTPTPTHTLLAPVVTTATGDDAYSVAFNVVLPQDNALPDTGYMGFGLKAERATNPLFTIGYTTETNLLNSTTISAGDADFLIANNLTPGTGYYFRFSVIPPIGDAVNLPSPTTAVGPLTVAGNPTSTLNPVSALLADSWVSAGNPPYPGYFAGAYYAAHPEHQVSNFSMGGQGLGYAASKIPDVVAIRPYVIFLSFGPNDFMNSGVTLSQYIASYADIINQFKTQLPGVAIAVRTLTERHASDGGADGSGGYNDLYNANRKAFNAQVRQWKTDGFIAQVVDIGADPVIGRDGGMEIGSPESADGLHLTEGPTPAGQGYAIPIFANAMNALYAATPLPSGGSTGDPDVSSFAISPTSLSQPEGNSGTTPFVYTVTRTGGTTYAAAIDWAVTGTGTNPAAATDFVGGTFPSGTVTFAAGATTGTITVNVAGDTSIESDETFTVTLTNGRTTGTITTAAATGTITNDDTSGSGGGGGGTQPVGYASTYSYEGAPGFATSFTFPTNQVYATAGKALVYIDSFGDASRQPATVTLTPTGGGTAVSLTRVNSSEGLWHANVSAGTYTLSMTATSAGFAYVGMVSVLATNAAATLGATQVQPGANRNNPISFPGSQVVGTNALGFYIVNSTSTVASRSDGSTERVALMINDTQFGGVHYVSLATLPATATPTYSLSANPGDRGIAVTVNAA